MVRSRRRSEVGERQNTDGVSLKDTDPSVNIIRCDSVCKDVGGGKSQKTDLKDIDGRERQEQEKKT